MCSYKCSHHSKEIISSIEAKVFSRKSSIFTGVCVQAVLSPAWRNYFCSSDFSFHNGDSTKAKKEKKIHLVFDFIPSYNFILLFY